MPPKKRSSTLSNSKRLNDYLKKNAHVSETQKNALASMFKRIESNDSKLKECPSCRQQVKSCLFNDHLQTKCSRQRANKASIENIEIESKSISDKDEIILIDEDEISLSKNVIKIETLNAETFGQSKEEIASLEETLFEKHQVESSQPSAPKKFKSDRESKTVDEDDGEENSAILNEFLNSFAQNQILNVNNSMKQSEKKEEEEEEEEEGKEKARRESLQIEPKIDYNLLNFSNAIESVLGEKTFSHLLDKTDHEIIHSFTNMAINSKKLYVRLFMRKFNWIKSDSINYEDQIGPDLGSFIQELFEKRFLIDEASIQSYEEIVSLFTLPQLKDLCKHFHIHTASSNNAKLRADYVKLVLQHFKTQQSLNFQANRKPKSDENCAANNLNNNFMKQCKQLLGKCFKLDKAKRDVFVRILMLYNLSSSYNSDAQKGNDSGQNQLIQILLLNLGKVKFANYEIKLSVNIFEDRSSLLRYQKSMEYENELLGYLDSKEYEQAYDALHKHVLDFRKQILDSKLNEYDQQLPVYLRKFTSNCMLVKFLSIYANEVLQKLKKYQQANEIFEFLLFEQQTYLLDSRAKWFERLALNLETHLKEPAKAYDVLEKGLCDLKYVKKAGRLALCQRLSKMKQTKRYAKLKDLSEKLKHSLYQIEKYDFIQAPTVEIEGTILHSEFIPGRKNVFIQNFEYDNAKKKKKKEEEEEVEEEVEEDENTSNCDGESIRKEQSSSSSGSLVKCRYNLSVEEVALTHYIKKLAYTDGKHAETATLSTLYGLLFWDILFESKTVSNVFVDRFQSRPLDLQTDHFYLNRKELIDCRLDLLSNSPIEFICELISDAWSSHKDTECSLISWSLFDSLEQLLSLVRCFTSNQLTSLCRYMSENYRYCRSGGPDLVVWSSRTQQCKFVEVKGPGDRLSHKQMVWLDFLIRNSIACEVCHVKGKNQKRLRD